MNWPLCLRTAVGDIWADCVKECMGEKSGTVGLAVEGQGHGESLSGSTTDDQPNEETNLLPSAAADDDCFAPLIDFPLDIIRPVEHLGEGIFGEVPLSLSLSLSLSLLYFGPAKRGLTVALA